VVAYGYRVGEVLLPPLGAIKQSAKFGPVAETDPQRRPPIAASLGCHLEGYTEPEPDPNDPFTMAAGVCKRFAVAPPTPDLSRLLRLQLFVRKFIRKNFTPLDWNSDTSVETWLEHTAYPLWRKEELKKVWEKCGGRLSSKDLRCKSFMKDETYPEYKHASLT